MILARIEVDFRSQAAPGDELEVGVRASRLGTKSFDLEYEVRAASASSPRAKPSSSATTTRAARPIEIPAEWRNGRSELAA